MLLFNRTSPHDPPRWAWQVADAVAIGGLIYFIFYYLTAFRFDTLFAVLERQVDFKQWYGFPPIIAEHLQYPSVVRNDWTIPFPYLPSAVVMFMPLSALPQTVAFGFWIVLQAVSLVVVLWAGLNLCGVAQHHGRLLIALGAVLMTDYQLGWDFRTHNNNVIYLALIMFGLTTQRAWLSGLLFGISCNLKIYSGFLIIGLICRREYRLAVSMIIASAFIAIILPIAVFGFSGYVQLLEGWIGQALFNPPAGQRAVLPANLLRSSATLLLGDDATSIAVSVLVYASLAVWLVLVIGYFVLATKSSRSATDDQSRLADVCVALLAPLPFSIWFLPYHAIVLLPAYMLLLTVAVSDDRRAWVRSVATAAMVICQILQHSITQWELRGATSIVSFILIVLALGTIRYLAIGAAEIPKECTHQRDACT